jgi:prolyl-tRNA synthetase
MTHEEIFTIVAAELRSYRELPQMWYQFQTKFRDEPRPKSGLIRVREFTMKDSYSFDLDPAGLDASFDRHFGAYQRIFQRLSLAAIPVEASNGTMGGSDSREFMCPTDAGEDIVVHCAQCGYAANVEKAIAALADIAESGVLDAPERFDTPGVRTIEDLAEQFGYAGARQIKTLVYVVDDQLTLVLLRGDHALVEQKLVDALGAIAVRPAQPEEIRAALGALPGSLGAVRTEHTPGGSREHSPAGLPVVADLALRGRRGMATGANIDDVHLRGVDVERDISVDRWADLRQVVAGETCARCGGELGELRTVEIGHIFKLGYKFTEALGVSVLTQDGRRIAPIMGSYGIGVERAMAAIVESHHDDKGIVWPMAVAPFHVVLVQLGSDEATVAAAQSLYDSLRNDGVEVLWDDRDERPGVKFSDVELIGVPVRVTVGARGLAERTSMVEVTDRATGETARVPLTQAAPHLLARVRAELGT